MPQVSVASEAISFQTTAPPPVISFPHIGRSSITVKWPHVYGTSEYVSHYKVTITPGGSVEVVAPSDLTPKEYTFTGLATSYTYTISVQAVNRPGGGKPDIVGPPGSSPVTTLSQWAEPPATGIDGWNGYTYTPGRTNFHYTQSGIFDNVDHWAKSTIGNLQVPGRYVQRKQGMSWIEFGITVAPELHITAIIMKAGSSQF